MKRPEALYEWLFGLQSVGFTLGLERVTSMLGALGNPQEDFEAVLVGGTNGKGSCARALAACLAEEGVCTGLYTSPHLSRLTERFRIAGEETSRPALEEVLREVQPVARSAGGSFFEVVTVCACLLFARQGVQTAVMEVGLGGRFDATNALEPRLSIVTGVALDHTSMLGSDVASIAREKAGIIRAGKLLLTGAEGDALVTLLKEAAARGADVWRSGEEIEVSANDLGWDGVEVTVSCPAGSATGRSPLVGAHQVRNLALAVAAALELGVGPEAAAAGLQKSGWPGRLERFRVGDRYVLFDGAHNPAAAEALAIALGRLGLQEYTLVAGVGRDKDLAGIASWLKAGASRVYATRALLSPRARAPREVAEAFGAGADAVDDPAQALASALAHTEAGGTVLVAGSLYLVGELRPLVSGEESESFERFQ